MLPKTSAYVKSYDGKTKWMYFLIQDDDDLLEEHNTIWDKVSAYINKEFDTEPFCNKEILETKIKSHGDEVTDFYDKKIKLDSTHTFFAVMSLDFPLKKDGNFYPQVFLKECKYSEKKLIRYVNDNLSDFSSSDKSDEEWIKAVWFMYF